MIETVERVDRVIRLADGRKFREQWVPASDGRPAQAMLIRYGKDHEVLHSVGLRLISREEVVG